MAHQNRGYQSEYQPSPSPVDLATDTMSNPEGENVQNVNHSHSIPMPQPNQEPEHVPEPRISFSDLGIPKNPLLDQGLAGKVIQTFFILILVIDYHQFKTRSLISNPCSTT